ncbi:Transforming growth factor beta receptor type 3 [Trichinella papuae]|uniref:Transforming growth factor beta receptor type 3 n=1 Tax=Trichinella papuae TaxID=268474 RepID=A0A0V1MPS4_9BILA|nr:Transforming growth factor beta receptor type 3 [Trichinella papuae]
MVVKWTLLWTTTAAVCTWSASCGHSENNNIIIEANNQQHYGESAPPIDGRMVSLGSIESMQIRVHTGNLAEPVKVLDLVQPDNAQSNDPAAALNRAFLAEMQSSIEVLCHDRFFLISVSRISARMLGVKQANQISFSNDSEEFCSATEKRSNATHIVLHSLYTKCNTERHVYSGREEYDNELLLTSEESANIVDYKVNRKVPPDSRMLTTTVVQIRCVKLVADEENGNENLTNMHETSAMDVLAIIVCCCIDTTRKMCYWYSFILLICTSHWHLSVHCDDNSTTTNKRHKETTSTREQISGKNHSFALQIYDSQWSTNAWMKFPHILRLGHRIFVNVMLQPTINSEQEKDDELKPLLKECFFTRQSSPTSLPRHSLIIAGCPVDTSVMVHYSRQPQEQQQQQQRFSRFSVEPSQFYFSGSFMFLHCSVAVCSDDRTNNIDEERAVLLSLPVHKGHDQDAANEATYVSSGPLHPVIVDETVRANCQPCESGHHRMSPEENQLLVVRGLSTGSVIAISSAAFIVGVLLMAGLWYIYEVTKTDIVLRNKRHTFDNECTSSTESTSVPTVHTRLTSVNVV